MGKVAGDRRPLTYDDFVHFPEDGKRHELIEGQHFVTPSPYIRHQRISGWLCHELYGQIELSGRGQVFAAPIDVVLTNTNVFVPDIVVVLSANQHIINEKNIRGAPDLVVEITSPSTKSRDLGRKLEVYERCRVPEYWIVLTEDDAVRKLVLEGSAYRDCGRFSDRIEFSGLPDVAVDLTRVW